MFDRKYLRVKKRTKSKCFLSPAALTAAVHGVGAEDGLQQRSAGAQPDPARRLLSQGGAGGEQEELPEEGAAHGGAGGGAEGETPTAWTGSGYGGFKREYLLSLPAGRTRSDEVPDPTVV